MEFIWWKLKTSYHTVYPSWDCPAVVCHLFLYSFICAPKTKFTWLSKFRTLQLSSVFFCLSLNHSCCRVSFLDQERNGTYNFENCLRRHGACKFKCAEKYFYKITNNIGMISSLSTHSISSLNLSHIQNLKKAQNVFYDTSFQNYSSIQHSFPLYTVYSHLSGLETESLCHLRLGKKPLSLINLFTH